MENKENEEISLIDLLAVVIRYRKLIILGTIIPIVLAALYLFVIQPKRKHVTQANEDVKAVYTVRLNYLPPKLYEGITQNYYRWWDWNTRMLQDFINPTIIGPLYEENQFANSCEKGQGENYVKPLIKEGKITCINSVETTYTITINMPITSEDKLNDFMEAFIQYEHDLIQEKFMGDHIELLKERCERKLKEVENANPQTVNFDEIQKAKDILQDIETYKRENKPFYEIQGKPVIERTVINPASSKKANLKKMLIVAFGSFFVFVFLAFLLNAIHSIKEDPEASKKIKDAWDNGKLLKK